MRLDKKEHHPDRCPCACFVRSIDPVGIQATAQEIDMLRAWIRAGAKDDSNTSGALPPAHQPAPAGESAVFQSLVRMTPSRREPHFSP